MPAGQGLAHVWRYADVRMYCSRNFMPLYLFPV